MIQIHQAVLCVSLRSLMFLFAVDVIFLFYCFCIQQLHFGFGSGMLICWLVLILRDREPLDANLLKQRNKEQVKVPKILVSESEMQDT